MTHASADYQYGAFRLSDIRSETEWMTPELARRIRQNCLFERQRPISETNVKRLANEMEAKWFVPGTPIFFAVLPDLTRLLLNGNHTLEGVALSGVSLPLTCIYCKVPDVEAAARIYATFDVHKVRSWGNTLQALGAGDGIARADRVLAACAFIVCDFAYDPSDPIVQSRTRRIEMMQEYSDAANLVAGCLQGAPTSVGRAIYQAPVLAVALATARYQPSSAQEFWGVIAQDELKNGHPGKALITYLRNSADARSRGAGRGEKTKAAALAWNAFFRGGELQMCKPNQMGDFVILGTKWHRPKTARPSVAAVVTARRQPMPTMGDAPSMFQG